MHFIENVPFILLWFPKVELEFLGLIFLFVWNQYIFKANHTFKNSSCGYAIMFSVGIQKNNVDFF